MFNINTATFEEFMLTLFWALILAPLILLVLMFIVLKTDSRRK